MRNRRRRIIIQKNRRMLIRRRELSCRCSRYPSSRSRGVSSLGMYLHPVRCASVHRTYRPGNPRRLSETGKRSGQASRSLYRARQCCDWQLFWCPIWAAFVPGKQSEQFYASGGYDPIAAHIFKRTRFHRFLLEYDDDRSGDFEPLRYVPDDRVVVLGLVTTKKPALETKEALKRRIMEATRFIPLERLALSPQCGFASTEEGNLLSPADQEAKLRLVAETAREVWS